LTAKIIGISDIHVGFPENRDLVAALRPDSPDDWVIVAGDVAERMSDIEWALGTLAERFAKVVWTPGNHELWTIKDDPVQARGVERYELLVERCRALGVVTPEDPYPVWRGPGGPLLVAPLFLLYDYSFRPEGTHSKATALAAAHSAGVVCTDEHFLFPDPHPSREAWCWARVEQTGKRLDDLDPALPTMLVNHWPLVREPTRILRYPEFALWCGTDRTADWHVRYRAATVVYGHLHIPRTTWYDGVRFREVSYGYPREWRPRTSGAPRPKQVFPLPDETPSKAGTFG
jgi:3',5'-cyclic AMP phosphodiesterase CpdA